MKKQKEAFQVLAIFLVLPILLRLGIQMPIALESSNIFQLCGGFLVGISQDIIVRDLVHGATYYYPHKKMRKPDWANSMVVTTILSGHTYLKQF